MGIKNKTVRNTVKYLESKGFKIIDHVETESTEKYIRPDSKIVMSHPSLDKIKISCCKPVLYILYQNKRNPLETRKIRILYGIKPVGLDTVIAFKPSDYSLNLTYKSEEIKDNNYRKFADYLPKFIDDLVSLDQKPITMTDRVQLTKAVVDARFQKKATKPTTEILHQSDPNFDYGYFLTPIKGASFKSLDINTWLGAIVTLYINIFDVKKSLSGKVKVHYREHGTYGEISYNPESYALSFPRRLVFLSTANIAIAKIIKEKQTTSIAAIL